ncbi:MAG: Smr/MutS family protein [Muribaculaceae bacterium]|nr:Smr/MutS family protein [Muribaculaceae bacterium]
MIYPSNFEKKIGFDSLRSYIKTKCLSSLGEYEVDIMHFSNEYDYIHSRLRETDEMLSILKNSIELPLDFIYDATTPLNRIKVEGSYLTEIELNSLKRSLITIEAIASFFEIKDETDIKYPFLADLTSDITSFKEIIKEIDLILDKFGNIKDNASPKLKEIRKSILATSSGINGLLRRILAQGRDEGFFEKDTMPAVRDGRLVIPVSPMNKRKIKGIIHDESATGKTVYIEPAEIVEANNRIRELEGDMQREIIRILIEISSKIRPSIDTMLESYSILGKIDFIRAKASVALALNALLPNISSSLELDWYHAIHPILFLALKEQNKEVVPLNISLNENDRILLISGPNAGGKSVCLKTVGIIQYMMQCGMLPLVYENSHMGIFDNIFIDIGDEQSIEDDLSTYSSHLTNMRTFVNKATEKTIILIDEFGGGTEPQIGGAIAQAILKNLNEKKTFGVITTHYQNLKHFAEDADGIINGAMLYDRQKMRPLFQLSIGYPGSSFAIEIARKIGLPASIISEAEDIVGSDYVNMDKYLLDIARDRKYWDNKRQDIRVKEKKLSSLVEKYDNEIDNISNERKEIIKKAKAEAKELLAQSNSLIERTIHDIKKAQAEREKTKVIRKQLDELKNKIINEDIQSNSIKKLNISNNKKNKRKDIPTDKSNITSTLSIGDNVTLDQSTSVGQIISIDEKIAIVAFGLMKTKVDINRLHKSNKNATTKNIIENKINFSNEEIRKRQLDFSPDIDVRGMSVDEATQAVTYFLDDAIQFNAKRVRILHGTGNGILRQRLREYINTFSGVKSYRDEHIQFGGTGITIVDLF